MKDTMTESSPSAETIRFVIEILSARPTPLGELRETISGISRKLASLGGDAPVHLAGRDTARDRGRETGHDARRSALRDAALAPPRRAAIRPKIAAAPTRPAASIKPSQPEASFVKPAMAAPAAPVIPPTTIIPPVMRRRGRPRRVERPELNLPPAQPDQPPPQPKLLRRAEALQHETEHGVEGAAPPRAAGGTLRGVVKWFDGRTGKGAMRLAGISGDVLLDAATLAQSGIKRLYKDQEIEAVVDQSSGRVRLLSLSLPARASEPALNMMPGEITGTVRRQPRQVQVEIKRDGIRQSAARAEAEQVLGGVGRIKANRRLTP
jgi:cold shock CspA family protein